MKRPWFKFSPKLWRGHAKLRMCSLAARGLWADIMSYMHESEPYGYFLIDGKQPTLDQTAALIGRPVKEVRTAIAELEQNGVFSRREDGAIFSRRMVRDKAKEETDRLYGKAGGNPHLTAPVNGSVAGGVNPPDKAPDKAKKVEEKREEEKKENKQDAAIAAPKIDLEKQLFDRAKVVLGPRSGGLIVNLIKAKGSIELARAAIEMAATKSNAREYIGACVRGENEVERGDAW